MAATFDIGILHRLHRHCSLPQLHPARITVCACQGRLCAITGDAWLATCGTRSTKFRGFIIWISTARGTYLGHSQLAVCRCRFLQSPAFLLVLCKVRRKFHTSNKAILTFRCSSVRRADKCLIQRWRFDSTLRFFACILIRAIIAFSSSSSTIRSSSESGIT